MRGNSGGQGPDGGGAGGYGKDPFGVRREQATSQKWYLP